jgi:protein ImuB
VDAKDAVNGPVVALRRFRMPIPARVRVEDGRPVRVWIDRRGYGGGQVDIAAGPWRTSGAWWAADEWSRDEWDVALTDGVTYRLFRERLSAGARCAEPGLPSRSPKGDHGLVTPKPRGGEGGWFIEGIVD